MSELQVYIVNVWRASGAAPEFRATARAVEDLEPQFFTSVDELSRYLAAAAGEPGPSSASGQPTTHRQRTSP